MSASACPARPGGAHRRRAAIALVARGARRLHGARPGNSRNGSLRRKPVVALAIWRNLRSGRPDPQTGARTREVEGRAWARGGRGRGTRARGRGAIQSSMYTRVHHDVRPGAGAGVVCGVCRLTRISYQYHGHATGRGTRAQRHARHEGGQRGRRQGWRTFDMTAMVYGRLGRRPPS